MGGPWSPQERSYHINCLELLAASLAVKTYLKGRTNSGFCFLYKQPGRDSLRPSNGAGERHPTVRATSPREGEHYSGLGVKNNEGSLRLDAQQVSLILTRFPCLNVDLFTSRLTTQLPRSFSWRSNSLAEVTDALLQDWRNPSGYANP